MIIRLDYRLILYCIVSLFDIINTFVLEQCQLICTLLDINDIDMFYENMLSKVADKIGPSVLDKVMDLGLLTEEPVLKLGSPLDTFSQFIASKLSLSEYMLILL